MVALALVSAAVTAAQPPPPEVTVVHPLAREVVEHDEFPGRFRAVERVEVVARVEGYLSAVRFREGDRVAKGDVLFEIDPRPFDAAVARARARLARAESERELAELELSRLERLLARDAVSQDEVDAQRASLAGAIADVDAARAALDAAELDRGYATIRAPMAGRVSSRSVDVGDLVRPGFMDGEPLTTLVALDPLHFVFDVSEADYLRYRRGVWSDGAEEGQPVRIGLLDEDGFPHRGRIDFRDNRLDERSATLRLRAVVPNAGGLLLPGLFGRVRVAATKPYRALLVPDQAIVSDQDRKLVLTVGADGEVTPRRVTLGPLQNGLRVVREGLDEGALVIVEGVLQARAAPRVSPGEPRDPAAFALGADGT